MRKIHYFYMLILFVISLSGCDFLKNALFPESFTEQLNSEVGINPHIDNIFATWDSTDSFFITVQYGGKLYIVNKPKGVYIIDEKTFKLEKTLKYPSSLTTDDAINNYLQSFATWGESANHYKCYQNTDGKLIIYDIASANEMELDTKNGTATVQQSNNQDHPGGNQLSIYHFSYSGQNYSIFHSDDNPAYMSVKLDDGTEISKLYQPADHLPYNVFYLQDAEGGIDNLIFFFVKAINTTPNRDYDSLFDIDIIGVIVPVSFVVSTGDHNYPYGKEIIKSSYKNQQVNGSGINFSHSNGKILVSGVTDIYGNNTFIYTENGQLLYSYKCKREPLILSETGDYFYMTGNDNIIRYRIE